jgi:hypothetical protein
MTRDPQPALEPGNKQLCNNFLPHIKSRNNRTKFTSLFSVQKLDESLFCCLEGHPHQIVDGSPLDPLHLCPATVATTVKMYLDTEASTRVTWSCGGCQRTYRSTTAECNQEDCSGLSSRLKSEVTKRTLEAIQHDILLQVLPYDQDGSNPPNILSPVKLAEVLLSPHDQELSGLMASAWNTSPNNGNLVCNCLSILEIQAGVSLDDNLEFQEVTPAPPPSQSLFK